MKQIKLSKETIVKIDSLLKKYRAKASCYKKDKNKDAMVVAYEHFSKSKNDSYKMAELYDVSVCPYCNINHTYVVGRKCRPDFDHFLPKSKYPNLALRVMNLIPCCQQCNSRLKLAKRMSYKNNVHPFLNDFDALAEFRLRSHGKILNELCNETDFELECVCRKGISPENQKKVSGNKEVFALNERYNHHKKEILQIIQKSYTYWDGYFKEIVTLINEKDDDKINALKATLKKDENMIRFIFPDLECDINSTSLGKLKRDISKYIKDAWEKV